jgi:hypothetical protein
MKDTFEWIVMVAAIVIGIIGAINKNKKKTEAEAVQKPRRQEQSHPEDLAEEMWRTWREAGTASPTVAPRPIARSAFPTMSGSVARRTATMPQSVTEQPVATSNDYYSLEDETEERYVGGERSGIGSYGLEGQLGVSDISSDSEIAAYERLAAERASRNTYMRADYTKDVVEEAMDEGNAQNYSLAEILGDKFDLRRAVIEAEIITPKYL